MNAQTFLIASAVTTAMAAVYAAVWRRLPVEARSALLVYVVSYFLTYCVGGIWIGLTDGEVLGGYFRDRLYIPSTEMLGASYWFVLLSPLVLPPCVTALILNVRRATRRLQTVSGQPPLWLYAMVFSGLSAYAIFRIFHGGVGLLQALVNVAALHGDTTTIIERRLELFDPGTTAAFGIVYSTLPALTHVALFKAAAGAKPWRAAAIASVILTLCVSLATFQIAPAAVFIAALLLSASHLNLIHMTSTKSMAWGVTFLLFLQALNGWKFADWTFVENIRHLIFRMPAAYPYYLDCFPGTIRFLGADWLGAITGRGSDPGSPFIVARYMYPDSVAGSAMAAPAHVQAYAEGGLLYALGCVAAVGILIAAVSVLYRKSRQSAIAHGLYIQGLVSLYYATQASFRGVLWHSYGFYWSMVGFVLLGAMSVRVGARLLPDSARLRAMETAHGAPIAVEAR